MGSSFLQNERDLLNVPGQSLLVAGGDGRMNLHPISRLNKYGCAPEPRDVLAVGSCTASSPSPRALQAVEEMRHILLRAYHDGELVAVAHEMMREIRVELARELALDEVPGIQVVLTPSGTDVEMLGVSLALQGDDRRLCNIVSGPEEVGSGTTDAAAGLHFDDRTPRGGNSTVGEPVNSAMSGRVHVETIGLRDEHGQMRPEAELNAQCRSMVDQAIARGERVMVHIVAHSKTGAHAPSLSCVRAIRAAYPDDVVVMVDAAQGRISRRGLRAAMDEGWLVLFTGSKFYAGPPFSGALFVPQNLASPEVGIGHLPDGFHGYFTAGELPTEWDQGRANLSDDPNLGLILRWRAALAEIKAYYAANPSDRYEVLRAFERTVPRILEESACVSLEDSAPPVDDDGSTPLLESKKTVFSFYLRPREGEEYFGVEALRNIFTWMNRDLGSCAGAFPEAVRDTLTARFHLGQPVVTSKSKDLAVLRVALGAALIVQLAEDERLGGDLASRLEWLTGRLLVLRSKLEFLAQNYATLERTLTMDELGADQ
jgi:hypothetical protein